MRKLIVKFITGVVLLLVVIIGLASMVGIPPAYLVYGPGVASGIGAKLLCSARYVSGFSAEQAFSDLEQYSPILSQVSVDYDDAARRVEVSLFGLSTDTATYLPGLGCAVDYDDEDVRRRLQVVEHTVSDAQWPLGNTVGPVDPTVQTVLESLIQRDNAAGYNTRALLVVHQGRIVAEAYAQETDANTPLLGWSMAKSLGAVMLGNLEARGLLDLSGKPGFAEWQADERVAIGIEDMLTMTDGLRFSEQYDPGDDATAMLFTSPSISGYALDAPLDNVPGSTFNYSSGTANLLSRLHMLTLGSPQQAYNDFMANIYQPLGMQHGVFETDASGILVGSSYFYASARDWARLGQMMLNEGSLNDQQIVTPDWVRRATSPNQSDNEQAYGYQWWLNSGDEQLRFDLLPADAYYASGNRSQVLMVIPSRDAVIVRLGWSGSGYPVNQNFAQILNAL